MSAPLQLIYPDWPAPASVRAACTTRLGGVSQGPYASLNLGRSGGDDPAAVSENRRRVAAALGLPAEPCWIRQVHGVHVAHMPHDAAHPEGAPPEADASHTGVRGVVCAVQAADCLPVLFCDEDATVVAAAHAGWRGLAGGVLQRTVSALPVRPDKLLAWLGPAIGPEAFEVGEEVRQAFVDADAGAAAAFRAGAVPGKWYADLFVLARRRLRQAGVERTYGGGISTHADASRFYSFRRDGVTGRMAAMIWMRDRD